MIYLKNITDAQTLMIPRNGVDAAAENLTFIARNTIDLEGFTLSVQDSGTSELYITISVAVPEGFANGEYQYQLMESDTMVSCGLLIIGDAENPYQYEKSITYQQYESE